MKFQIYINLILLLLINPAQAQELPTLNVYTYDSFSSEWGPGPKLKQSFEKQCECKVEYVALGDSLAMLGRLKLEGEDTTADVVVGLDMNTLSLAKQSGLFTEHLLTLGDSVLPQPWKDEVFIPFDYGYFAFVYDNDKLTDPPSSFEQLIEQGETGKLKIVIQDPRSSTPGLGLLLWVKSIYGEQAGDIWKKLSPSLLTVTPGWSEAYGLFLEGEADMVLSYTTSPAYHMIAENKHNYKAAEFNQGHYIQIETAAMLKHSQKPELARNFLSFLLSPQAQSIIPTGNWMYPVTLDKGDLPDAFQMLISPPKTHMMNPDDIARNKQQWTEEFINSISQQ